MIESLKIFDNNSLKLPTHGTSMIHPRKIMSRDGTSTFEAHYLGLVSNKDLTNYGFWVPSKHFKDGFDLVKIPTTSNGRLRTTTIRPPETSRPPMVPLPVLPVVLIRVAPVLPENQGGGWSSESIFQAGKTPTWEKQRLMRVTFERTVFENIVEDEIKVAERTRAAAEAQSIALATGGRVYLIPVQTIATTTTTESPAPPLGRLEHATASVLSEAPSTMPSGHDPETSIALYTSSRDQDAFLDSVYDFDYDHIASGGSGSVTVRLYNISPGEEARSDAEYAGEASRDNLCEQLKRVGIKAATQCPLTSQ
jgi:hypothetical protein